MGQMAATAGGVAIGSAVVSVINRSIDSKLIFANNFHFRIS